MKIENINKSNKKLSDKDFSKLFSNIFEVCNNLPQFKTSKDNINNIEEKKIQILEKIKKQSDILDKTSSMKIELTEKIKMLHDENRKISIQLLSAIGGD